jgi:hypothetical protein
VDNSQVYTQQGRLIQSHKAALLCYPQKLNFLAGLEPGLSVSKADAMSTAPRRQGNLKGPR